MNWFTVVAQIINFPVLVALLRIFLYKRIIKAMDARQAKIAEALAQADAKQNEAEEQAESYRRKNREIEGQRQKMFAEAAQEAETRRKELTRQAQQDVEQLAARWKQTVHEETGQFLQQLRESAGQQACAISRKALADLADADLEEKVIGVFLRCIQEMDEAQRREFAEAAGLADKSVTVSSSFEIPERRRQKLTEAAQRLTDDKRAVAFERDPQLICGIALRVGGRAIDWNIDRYLDALAEDFAEVLREEGEPEAPHKAEGAGGDGDD